ncbi:MAG: succinate dehydrogenase, hydrophobic membrane anchor protein [Defluviicoccus sp.]|nr:succinate dehydrogenase, hydrophobic membrane anchor protein [Defluviicoccus sp.]MDE0277528.1 succinate dehydrogenase, hydrophobic membrane anchor protein [Defluviicoccus sp.]
MSLRTPLGRVRGLGSAKEGTAHWWAQRLTAVALVPLVLWFAVSLIVLTGADHATVAAWLRDPVAAVLMLLLILAGFHHAQLGVQVVIEDYVHSEGLKLTLVTAVRFAAVALGIGAAFSVLKIAIGG